MDQGEFTFHIAGTNDAAAVLLGGDGTRSGGEVRRGMVERRADTRIFI